MIRNQKSAENPNCKFLHCILCHEALSSKKLKTNFSDEASKLEKLMSDVVEIVNAIHLKTKPSRLFSKLCDEMFADHKTTSTK